MSNSDVLGLVIGAIALIVFLLILYHIYVTSDDNKDEQVV